MTGTLKLEQFRILIDCMVTLGMDPADTALDAASISTYYAIKMRSIHPDTSKIKLTSAQYHEERLVIQGARFVLNTLLEADVKPDDENCSLCNNNNVLRPMCNKCNGTGKRMKVRRRSQ